MAGRASKSKKPKTRQTGKQPSAIARLMRLTMTGIARLGKAAGMLVLRNPLASGGVTAFLVVMGFVSANALWYQPQAHDDVFFRTRPDLVFRAIPKPQLSGLQAVNPQPDLAPTAVSSQNTSSGDMDHLPALSAGADLDIARMQQKLSDLGLYNGPVDGLPGPQTRDALARWNAAQKIPESVSQVSEKLAVALPQQKPQLAQQADNKTPFKAEQTMQKDVTAQDIVHVQAGLKAFGNERIVIDGVIGQSTRDAVREFQKLFGLSVTGEVDWALIDKMREVGLIV